MSDKVTWIAPSNIAFLKYWGAVDLERALPANVSLSMTLGSCVTRTTLERIDAAEHHVESVGEGGEPGAAPPAFRERAVAHLEVLKRLTGRDGSYRMASANSFPSAAGIASSASGFAALASAFAALEGLEADAAALSLLARASGSGSAARSVMGGYVEWPSAAGDPEAPARQVAAADHWELSDVIVVVDSGPKGVSSRDGHARAATSPHFARRLELLPERLADMREALLFRDLERLGRALEDEATELHLVAMSSRPPIFYWLAGTLEVLAVARALRRDGVGVWATMDAGPNVHLICEPADEARVVAAVEDLALVEGVIRDGVGGGPRPSGKHLF